MPRLIYYDIWTPIEEYLKIRPLPNSKVSPISLSQQVTARSKSDTNLGKIDNRDCNLSRMMLALSSVKSVQTGFNLKMLFLRSMFTTGRAHYGQLSSHHKNCTLSSNQELLVVNQ